MIKRGADFGDRLVGRAVISVLVATVVLTLAVACGDGDGGGAEGGDAEAIIIGMPIALSGPVNFFDEAMLVGVQLAVEDINEDGGVLGRPLEVVTVDTKSDLALVATAAEEVIARGADFVVPTVDYNFGVAAARVATSRNLIAITQAGDPRWGVEGLGPLVYNVYQGTPTEGASHASFAYDTMKWRRPFILTDAGLSYTTTLCDFFAEVWVQLAGEGSIAGRATFQNDDPSVASQITRIRSANPDFIMFCSYAPGGPAALRQIRAAGIDIPMLGAATFDSSNWQEGVPNLGEFYTSASGVISGGDPDPDRERLYSAYRKKTGEPIGLGVNVLSGYSIVQALAIAVERAGSIETEAVKRELDKFQNEPLAAGETTWTPKCHIPIGRGYVFVRATTEEVVADGVTTPKFEFVDQVTPPKEVIPPSIC